MALPIDLTGHTYGRLTVLYEDGRWAVTLTKLMLH
jgi:hypothetical protein